MIQIQHIGKIQLGRMEVTDPLVKVVNVIHNVEDESCTLEVCFESEGFKSNTRHIGPYSLEAPDTQAIKDALQTYLSENTIQ